ncbi:MAG: glycosyltransferase [Candidatus Omnitrophota bacterium]|nr:glycosyltransferase [Candidatus Omnitrophota bacterium]
MTVSIIIAVKELNANLKECLKHCLNLSYPDFEIIVLPDEMFFYQNECVKIIPTGNLTAPQKRDFALKEAKGEILAFIDDDAYPLRDWLNYAISSFQEQGIGAEGIGAVCGPAITPTSDSLRQKASGLVYSSFLVSFFQNYRYAPKKKRLVEDYPSCNFFVRKDIFDSAGGFNTLFWPGEDTFLCLKIISTGSKILYDPKVLVYHHRRPLFKKHLIQVKNYAIHRGYFAKRFPQTSFKFSYFVPSIFLGFIVLGGLVALPFFGLGILYFLVLWLYLFLVFICSFSKDLRMVFLKFFGIIFTHLTYGFFFIVGLFSKKMKEEL